MNHHEKVIAEFLAENPQFSAVEWLPEYQDLTVWYKDSDEPICKNEYIKYSPTWNLLDDLEDKLSELPCPTQKVFKKA